jgi:hypothetical protein
MGRTCSCCTHPQRDELDKAIAAGNSDGQVAALFARPYRSVRRHRLFHVSRIVQAETQRRGVSIMAELHDWKDRLIGELERCIAAGYDSRNTPQLLRELREYLRLIGEQTGEIAPRQVTLLLGKYGVASEDDLRRIVERDKEMQQLTLEDCERDSVAALQLVLAEHPERRARVLRALAGREVDVQAPRLPATGKTEAGEGDFT